MQVTRKRRGFTLLCSDGEYQALVRFVTLSEGAGKLRDNAKSAYTRRVKKGDFLRVDIDKRETRGAELSA